MPRPDERSDREQETTPQAKRTGRDAPEPESQPGEFLNDMEVNRKGDPPPPSRRGRKD